MLVTVVPINFVISNKYCIKQSLIVFMQYYVIV